MRIIILGALASVLSISQTAMADTEECHDVELVPETMGYHVNNGIAADGHQIRFVSFTTAGGQSLSGSATVLSRSVNGSTVKGLELKDIGVRHASTPSPNRVIVRYTDFGGGVNLRVNGALVVASRLGGLNDTQLGGVSISVQESQVGSVRVGTLRLEGGITSFVVGGRSLLLRQACGRFP